MDSEVQELEVFIDSNEWNNISTEDKVNVINELSKNVIDSGVDKMTVRWIEREVEKA